MLVVTLFVFSRAMATQRTSLDYLASKTDEQVRTCDLPAFVRRCLRFLGADIRLLLSQPIIDNETAIECLWIWIRESSQNGQWLNQDWSSVGNYELDWDYHFVHVAQAWILLYAAGCKINLSE